MATNKMTRIRSLLFLLLISAPFLTEAAGSQPDTIAGRIESFDLAQQQLSINGLTLPLAAGATIHAPDGQSLGSDQLQAGEHIRCRLEEHGSGSQAQWEIEEIWVVAQ